MSTQRKAGLFGIGLDTYWPQFKGLLGRLTGYQQEIARRLRGFGLDLVDDLVDARDLFDSLYGREHDFIRNWDEARVAAPIDSFDAFAAYCCSNPACGPL